MHTQPAKKKCFCSSNSISSSRLKTEEGLCTGSLLCPRKQQSRSKQSGEGRSGCYVCEKIENVAMSDEKCFQMVALSNITVVLCFNGPAANGHTETNGNQNDRMLMPL